MGIIDLIEKEAAAGLVVLVRDLRRQSGEGVRNERATLRIGDEIQFELAAETTAPLRCMILILRFNI